MADSDNANVILAVVGYAVGTAQIVLVDWERARREHQRQLRLIRSHLRHYAEFRKKFNLSMTQPPESDLMPRLPMLSESFIPTVSATNFALTDEHLDDNSQEALLSIEDALAAMRENHTRVIARVDAVLAATDPIVVLKAMERMVGMANDYDSEVDRFIYIVEDALRDIDRRLSIAGLRAQVRRVGKTLPQGVNPPPLERGDARLKAIGPLEKKS